MTEQPPNSVFVRIHDGSEICVPNVIRRLTTYVLLEQEDWFESEIGFVRKAVQPGQAAIDIGASFGLYTSALGRATGPAGKVWAFEPAAVPRTHLLATLQRNGLAHVEVFAHALSDAPGEQVLANPGDTELGQLGGDEVFGERVSVETLDRLAGSFGDRPIDFVKLDAEGLEPRIIAAGHRIFADHSPLVMTEIVQGVTYQPAIADALQALGYDVFRHVPALNILVPFDAATRDAYLINVFACKPDRAAQLQARQLLVRETAPPAEPAPDAWLKLLAPMPYFGPLQAQMNRFAARPNHIADDTYRRALNLYAASRDENAGAAHRWAALAEADRLLRGYEGDNIPHPQALSSARVAADIGRRVDAYNLFTGLLNAVKRGERLRLTEMFLAPSVRSENWDSGGRFSEWLAAGLFTEFERLRAHSSYFSNDATVNFIERNRSSVFHSSFLERRWQLMRMATGAQSAPQPHDLLAAATPDNLNPALWQADSPLVAVEMYSIG